MPKKNRINNSILQSIGNTILLELRNIVPSGHARVLLKLEGENPTGSMKDRMALAMVEVAEADGRLQMWDDDLADEISTVSTDEAMQMSRRLAREEALFAGTSTGGNVVAALRVAEQLGPEATVVSLMCDSGLKYLSTDLYKNV